jgi:hypothetical protein
MTLKQFIYRSGLVFLGSFVGCYQAVVAQALTTTINRNDILIGEHIQYELKVNLANSSYKIDIGLPDSIPHFDIISQDKYDTVDANGVYTLRQHILITSFDSGIWKIPSFPVTISFPNKASQKFVSDSFLVRVGYSPADSTGQLRDIKPVMEVFVVDRSWLYIAAAILLGLLLAVLLYRYFKNLKKKTPPLFNSSLSAYEEAMKALKPLEQQSAVDSIATRQFYTLLGDIFKKYYSRKTNSNLMSVTTGDILILLQTHAKSPETLSTAAQALRCGDAVKFAKYIPPASENTQSVLQIKNTIEQLEKKSTF